MSRFRPTRPPAEPPERGAHTLDVVPGTIVGIYGDDVFVELGPRKQGVLGLHAFDEPPSVGEVHRFTMRGREDNLWILNLVQERTLTEWEELEPGSLATARIVRKSPDGFQLKLGPLHAYMPFSQSGVRKARERSALVGRSVVVEVLEVDDDKQRAIVSRKSVLKMQRAGGSPHAVVPGQTVQGRVSRIESYGVFIRMGRGREGLCHVSNLSVERIDHPTDVVALGDVVEARVLYVRAGGKRIGLGLKQMHESPWSRVEREHWVGQIVSIEITRVGSFGGVGRLLPGVEGVVPISECGDKAPPAGLRVGERLSARVLDLEPEDERIAFSLLFEDGRAIAHDEYEAVCEFEESRELPLIRDVLGETREGRAASEGASTNLGDLLRRALEGERREPRTG
ncbi:MAG: S1 RNA-binding domain-containing protein [Planctomycetota bacterium]